MLKRLYRRILLKLNLSHQELVLLDSRLIPQNICVGPFQKDGKQCPNTTALGIKHKVATFSDSSEIRAYFKQHGVTNGELWLFYFLFDMPAQLSQKVAERSLRTLRGVVKELL